ncbi:MAG: hypothetical protein ABIO70_11110 [Pseudomonadota bacterium]
MKDWEARINDGSRPSRLELDRLAVGELEGEQAARIETAVGIECIQARAAAIDATREKVAPFDAEILRKRAYRCAGEDEAAAARRVEEARRARIGARPWWQRWLPVGAGVAAVAVLLLNIQPPPEPGQRHTAKGEGDIDFYLLRGDHVHPGSEDELHYAGDRVQFTYRTVGEDSLVLVSVDGRGGLSVYYPREGERPLEVVPGERRVLEGSILLDDAPDYELILAFFGARSVREVVEEVSAVRAADGVEGLRALARDAPDVDAVYLRKGRLDGAPGQEPPAP